jgi:molybdate transport system substrate-binding protein
VASARDLTASGVRRIAIGDPAAVPAGVYAKAYLEEEGLWASLVSKLIPTTNVRAALAAVQNGGADAAIVYATDVRLAPGLRVAAVLDAAATGPILYPAAVIRTSRRPGPAAGFLDFLRSDAGQRIFERHGFLRAPARR